MSRKSVKLIKYWVFCTTDVGVYDIAAQVLDTLDYLLLSLIKYLLIRNN